MSAFDSPGGSGMAANTWSAIGTTGQHVHAIAFTRRDGRAVSLCSYELPVRETTENLPACPDCSKKLRSLIDSMPGNVAV
jgi:hypothetical protein